MDYFADNKKDAWKFAKEEPLVKAFAGVISKTKQAAIDGDLPYRDRNWSDYFTVIVNAIGDILDNELS